MAEVAIILPPVIGGPLPAHPKVTLAGESGTVTFDITDRETDLSDLAAKADQVMRPTLRPLLQQTGKTLASLTLSAVIGTDPYASTTIAPRLAVLNNIADRFERCALAYSSLESARALGGWRITDLRIHVLRRRHGDNEPTSARVSITLTEASDIIGPATVGMKTSGPARTSGSPRRVVAVQGESLHTMATAAYGDGSRWPEIADANGIRDPRRVTSGMSLLIP